MATTDLHAQILPYDYYADRPSTRPCLAKIATLVRDLRAEGIASILVDNGDFVQGNPMADWAAGEGRDHPHPVIRAMNALGYDAAALGNHEFNYGLPLVERIAHEADFPLLAANLSVARWAVAPTHLVVRDITDSAGVSHPLRIGLLGLAPPQIRQWERLTLEGALEAEDILTAAARSIAALKAQGADLVVALAHTGLGTGAEAAFGENVGRCLSHLEGIDALVLGHVHERFPFSDSEEAVLETCLNGVPTVMPGDHASHLGVIDFALNYAAGRWHVAGQEVRLLPVTADTAVDAKVVGAMEDIHALVLGKIRRDVGFTERRIQSHFSLVRADESLQVVADAQSFAARAALDGTAYAHLPLLSAVAPFRAGGRAGPEAYIDLPAGPLSFSNAAELYLYPNSLCVVKTNGAIIADWLERSAGLFHQLQQGATDQPLINPDFPSYNFDVLFGLTYQIDLHQPVIGAGGQRIRNLRHNGRRLTADMEFAVVTNTYRAGGAGGFDALVEGASVIHRDTRKLRDVVISHLHHFAPRAADPVWSFTPMRATSAWFQTHPAADPPADLAESLSDLGLDRLGFRRFALDLS